MKKIGIFICAFIIIAIAIGVGVFVFSKENKPKSSSSNVNNEIIANEIDYSVKNDITIITNTEEEKTSPNATLILKRRYKECGHTIKEYKKITEDLVNLTEDELQKKLKDWKIEEFSRGQVILIKEVEGICNEHYILKDQNGVIAIYKIDENNQEILEDLTGISTEYLTENDKLEIERGIQIYGKEELNSILENYE